jgi:hypothetical protein
MTKLEQLIDRVGQITFRLETNFQTYRRSIGSFQHPENMTHAREALEADLENLKAAKAELLALVEGAAVVVALAEEERQMVLMALAHLACERPGWDDALSRIALRIDNARDGKPQMFERFKDIHRDMLRLDTAAKPGA